jgi:DNA-directed RNA polymerase subunit RPC12/RpoP
MEGQFASTMASNEEKQRRMEIRRDIGNRKVGVSHTLPHSSHAYLGAHACFNCRKSFKLSYEEEHICSNCGNKIYLMGRSFKAPKRRDLEQWKKVQKLYALGFRFHRYGGDYPPLPEQLREVDRFVQQYPDHELRVAEPDPSLLPNNQ